MTIYTLKGEADWHKHRAQYITASEAAIVVGMDPYGSPGKLKKDTGFTGNASTIVGQVLEPVVVDITNRMMKTQFALYETIEGKVFYTKGKLGATPDATDGERLLECKTTRPDIYLKYREEPPTRYLVQLQVQLWCTDKKEGFLSILSTDLTQSYLNSAPIWPIVIYKIQRQDELCNLIEQEATRFFESEKFRVDSKVKKQCAELLHSCYTKETRSISDKLAEVLNV